jgi:sec-independent protein translocase protein TatA
MLLFISGAEIFIVIAAYVMIFGAKNVPEVARQLGKGFRQLKDATNDVKREILSTADKQGIDTSVLDDVRKKVTEIEEEVVSFKDDIEGTIKRG